MHEKIATKNINVLSLSYAKELFLNPEESLGDTLTRTLSYSEQINSYTLIIHTLRRDKFQKKQLSSNCVAIPTNGLNRIHSLIKMYILSNRVLKKESVSLIQCQEPIFTGFIGLLLKNKYGIPLNVLLYGGNIYDENWLNQRFINKTFSCIGRFVIKRANGIQVEASLIKESLINNRVPLDKIYLKPMVPHNLDEFNKASGDEVREQISKKTNFKHIILFVGRLIKEKNLNNLFKVFKIVKQNFPYTGFIIIGEGKEKEALMKEANELEIDDNIVWLSHIPHCELPKYYKAADIFVLFSSSEGFPRVLMEAAAAGIPIVSTKVSGSTDAIKDGETGFIVPVNDIEQCAEKIMLLLSDPALRLAMGIEARFFIKNIGTFQDNINKQINIWQKLISQYHHKLK